MKWLIIASGLLSTVLVKSQELTSLQVNRLANAINWAENSPRYPYGVRSIKVKNAKEARQICMNSIKNSYSRWKDAGKPGSFISFLGARYAPLSSHKLNLFWVKNVSYFYVGQEFK